MEDILRQLYADSPAAAIDTRIPPEALTVDAIATAARGIDNGAAGVALACIYLKNGHLDAAHELANDIGGKDGDAAHALMHRMEGDFSNTRYWHHRAGTHPTHTTALQDIQTGLVDVLADGAYNPVVLTAAIESGHNDLDELVALHNAEIDALFHHCLSQVEEGP